MPTLGVFAKWPEPGRVKTRLGLPPDQAARVAEAFLRDTLARCTSISGVLGLRRIVVFAPAEADASFAGLLSTGWDREPQSDGDLGSRLTAFFSRHLPAGPVLAIGTDSPTLPVEFITQALEALQRANVVLGPACDGGYYLVGVSGELPPIFESIDWSGPRVLQQTVAALSDPRWRLALLPPWYDVDTPNDWHLLRGHLAALRRAGIDPETPHTERLLEL